MSRRQLRSVWVLIGLVAAVGTPFQSMLAPVAAQPPGEPAEASNPLDLVRGLREQGMADLALEYILDLDRKPGIPQKLKDELPLERAKCQLDAADEEPDEGTRISLVGEAKEGFSTFLKNNPTHPRAAEAFMALARLTSLEAKAQLSKARRMELPPAADADYEPALQKQKAEAGKARHLFEAASNQLKNAVELIDVQLRKNPDPTTKRSLTQTLYEAELTRGIDQFSLAETYLESSASTEDIKARSDRVDEARKTFSALMDREGAPPRVTGVARAWMSECAFVKRDPKAEDEVKRIESMTSPESEDAKRMVRFFKLRRAFLSALGATSELPAAVKQAKEWIGHYGTLRRAQAEAVAVRWYLAFMLQVEGDNLMGKATVPKVPPKVPLPPPTVPAGARAKYQEAEKLYRLIAQTDNEYTERASKQRMVVVRRLLGEADQPPASYKLFEECQMAALIQIARMLDLQKEGDKNKEAIQDRQHKIVALLERARELATPHDSVADVADVLLRLIYFYQLTDQPYQAAILGEHVARTMKAPGGKAAMAGSRGLLAYSAATAVLKTAEAEKVDGARKADRDRAIHLARFLDEKYPNDTATDLARHRLGRLLYDDGKPVEAYDALLKVRAGYESVTAARLFQGAIVAQLLSAKDSPLPKERHRDVFRRTAADLDKLPRPLPGASEGEVRAFIAVRWRLATLDLQQPRVDPEGEKVDPGYAKARKIADEMLALVPTFPLFIADAATKELNLDGWEMRLLAEDAKTKAVLLEGQTLFVQGRYDDAYKAIGDLLAEMNRTTPFADQVKVVTAAGMKPPAKKEPEPKKEPAPAPMKEPEKKAPDPKPEPAAGMPEKDPDADQKEQVAKRASGVDHFRRELIVLALMVRVKQGQAEKGIEQLDLLKKYGGGIEANIASLEQITGEMAGQIAALKREGKQADAKNLSEGFGKLLDKLSGEPNLPVKMQRFLGQSLIVVGEFDKAIEALKKVPPPADKSLLAKPNEIADGDVKKSVLEYRRATLELIRAYRGANKYAEADSLLKESIGGPGKEGWAYSSHDFRKEVAYLYEAQGAAAAVPKPANELWGKGLQEWATMVAIYRKQLQNLPPAKEGGGGNQRLIVMNAYFEAYYNHQRCLVKANLHLLAAPTHAAKLKKIIDDTGTRFVDLEKASAAEINPDVRDKYRELLMEVPELKQAYEAAGGKFFLEKPAGGM